ncbi:MAG: XTP/dITP diphosphatase [Bacillota bacterium]
MILATNNAGKARELNAMLAGLGVEIIAQGTLGIPAVEETGRSFAENAVLKARHAAQASGLPAVADDSGLEVDALGGAPGIYSARYAGPKASDRDNLEKLLGELKGLPEARRGARFRCAIAYLAAPGAEPKVFEAAWEGRILESARGHNGFGYDPVFFVPEKGCASAELSPEVKNKLSHRGQAFARLADYLRGTH